MTQSINVLADLLLQTSGKVVIKEDGSSEVIPNMEMLKYRLMNIDSDNFSAFLKEIFDLESLVNSFDRELTPETATVMKQEISEVIGNYLKAVTGKSSEGGMLVKELLRDEQTMFHFYKDDSRKKSWADRIPSFQGRDDDGPEQPPEHNRRYE